MHKKQKLSPAVSLSNSYDTKERKHGFANLCNENTMKCTDVVNPGKFYFNWHIETVYNKIVTASMAKKYKFCYKGFLQLLINLFDCN